MEHIDIEARRLFFERFASDGEKGSLVFIHGSGGDKTKWQKQLDTLPSGYVGIAIDLPGHGDSTGPTCQSVAEMAEIINALLQALSLPRPVVVVGHSMGSAICLQLALDYPKAIEGMVLIGGGSRMKVMPSLLEDLAQGHNQTSFVPLGFAQESPRSLVEAEQAACAKVDAALLLADFMACNEFDISSQLNRIITPALMIVGKEDRLTPLKYSEYLQKSIPGSQLLIIPAAGHYVMLEQSTSVNQALQDFLARL